MKRRRNEKLRCDVVVVGLGYAGLAAVLEARKAGASVIALGRKNVLACNSAIGAGGFILVDTPLQREQGIEDSPELFAEDILTANSHTVNEDVVMAAAREATELYDWLTELGARFTRVRRLPGHSVARSHLEGGMGGARILKVLLQAAEDRGADVRAGVLAHRLIVNDSNEVEGVHARRENKDVEIEADQGVVLAAGGFGRDRDMVEQFLPRMSRMYCASGLGSTGDGIRMGMEIGAKAINMDAAVLNPLGSIRGATIPGTIEAMAQGAILVNKEGRRFVDERKGIFSDTAFPLMLQPDNVALLVFGETLKRRTEKLEEDMDRYVAKGSFLYGRTADDLAAKANIEKEMFRATVEGYDLSGGLYGTWVRPLLVMTHGGLMVNSKAQVIHREGHVIPRLYAAGDNTAGLGGSITADRPYPGYIGSGYLWALAAGRIAGRQASQQKNTNQRYLKFPGPVILNPFQDLTKLDQWVRC
jgi:flavocytochrome c